MRDERQRAWKIEKEEDKFDSNVERKYWNFTCNQLMEGEGAAVWKGKKMINGLLGLLMPNG